MSDPRYSVEAYEFLCQALAYTQQVVVPRPKSPPPEKGKGEDGINHVSGQQLCEGIRRYALDQFGLMAPVVLKCWGIRESADFGRMVYHLIEAGLWHKSDDDSIDHFSNQFDIETAFREEEIDWNREA